MHVIYAGSYRVTDAKTYEDAVRICRAIRSGTWGSHIKNLPLKIFSK
jgi:hypothetical protein